VAIQVIEHRRSRQPEVPDALPTYRQAEKVRSSPGQVEAFG
jgi:hypothetical protein